MPKHNVYRDGRVHVMSEECATCIFRPATRPVSGARVAELIRETMNEDSATVVCHSTIYVDDVDNAICRGWWDRFATRDQTLRMAVALDIVTEQAPP